MEGLCPHVGMDGCDKAVVPTFLNPACAPGTLDGSNQTPSTRRALAHLTEQPMTRFT